MTSQVLNGAGHARKPRNNRLFRFFPARPDDPEARRKGRARFARFLGYYRPHLPLLTAILASAVLVAATAIAMPLLANHIVARLPELADSPDATRQLLFIGGVMLVIFVLQALATYFVDYQGHVMGARIEAQVRRELFEHCQKLSFTFYDRQRTG